MNALIISLGFILAIVLIIFIRDFTQKKNSVIRNFPVMGHFRYILIKLGAPIRQYLIASNREELPFNRSQRNWIDNSADGENNYEGFGTDKDLYNPGHVFINPKMFPYVPDEGHVNIKDPSFIPCAKVIGSHRNRKNPFRPYSVVNISAMSYGSLSANAHIALNKGAALVGCYHNTGEGGLSPYHQLGGDVVFHIGTGYYGCGITKDGKRYFDIEAFKKLALNKYSRIRAIEVKLSQGAKPGKGGVLPASKNTKEIAAIRGVEPHTDVLSPNHHSAFSNVRELVDFIEYLANETGLPVGIKSAVGDLGAWEELASIMKQENKGPDFITIDGGEGGTGAAPPSFADHVALPLVFGFSEVYGVFQKAGVANNLVWGASGKLGFPSELLKIFAMGADFINVAREAMMAIGCIQAQECQTGHCPTGIATQSKRLQRGLDPEFKKLRFARYINTLRKETLQMTHACGYEHPCQIKMKDVDVSCGDNNRTVTLEHAYGYVKDQVKFNSMNDFFDCDHLGGLEKKENIMNRGGH